MGIAGGWRAWLDHGELLVGQVAGASEPTMGGFIWVILWENGYCELLVGQECWIMWRIFMGDQNQEQRWSG